MKFFKEFKKLGRLFENDEDRAYREAYDKEAVKQARLKGEKDAKDKYSDDLKNRRPGGNRDGGRFCKPAIA